jgi:hypothetical protein
MAMSPSDTPLMAQATHAQVAGAKPGNSAAVETPPVWVPFALLANEFGVLVLLINAFALEGASFGRLTILLWFGFLSIISCRCVFDCRILPPVNRGSSHLLHWFCGMVSFVLILGIGTALIGICHLPGSWPLWLVMSGLAGAINDNSA